MTKIVQKPKWRKRKERNEQPNQRQRSEIRRNGYTGFQTIENWKETYTLHKLFYDIAKVVVFNK